jgi:glycosyltransferase involved in cell wall biosynthesis
MVSFEKAVRSPAEDASDQKQMASYLREQGIRWIRLCYHKRPSLPATLYDIAQGILQAAREHSQERVALVHARGYVPGAIAWGLKRWLGIPYLFDIRGLQAEEYVDAGQWQAHEFRFWLTKRVEQWILRDTDAMVTLTEAIRPVLSNFPGLRSRPMLPPWEVIPCCVDLDHFRFREEGRRRVRGEFGMGERPVLVYAGSIGTWYLLEEMVEFFTVARRTLPELFFLILANGSSDAVWAVLRKHGIDDKDVAVRWVRSGELPDYLSAADAGIAFIRPCLSKRSSSPSKYAEYLACGLPIVINGGIGDADALIEQERAGVLVKAFDVESYNRALAELRRHLSRGRDVFRKIAEKHFSVSDRACPAYRRVYERILAG